MNIIYIKEDIQDTPNNITNEKLVRKIRFNYMTARSRFTIITCDAGLACFPSSLFALFPP